MFLRHLHWKWKLTLCIAAAVFVGLYGLLAYIVLPLTWRHYEHQSGLAGLPMVTRTGDFIPGDPINVGLVGAEEDVLCAMNAAAWDPADPITLRSSLKIVGSVLLDRPYHDAPVSALYYRNKREDLAFEKPVGISADRRHHVRLWKVLANGEEGRVVWLGAATFDRGVGLSRTDAKITHHIAPDIDADRDLLTADLAAAKVVETVYQVTGIGPTLHGRNGEGDAYYTDGDIKISVLVAGCGQRANTVVQLSDPPLVTIKNRAWSLIEQVLPNATLSSSPGGARTE
jgi:hypothetical protein